MTYRTDTVFRFATFIALAIAVLTTTGCCTGGGSSGSQTQSTDIPVLTLERAFPSLSFASPVAMLQAPGDNTLWFVVERDSNSVNGSE